LALASARAFLATAREQGTELRCGQPLPASRGSHGPSSTSRPTGWTRSSRGGRSSLAQTTVRSAQSSRYSCSRGTVFCCRINIPPVGRDTSWDCRLESSAVQAAAHGDLDKNLTLCARSRSSQFYLAQGSLPKTLTKPTRSVTVDVGVSASGPRYRGSNPCLPATRDSPEGSPEVPLIFPGKHAPSAAAPRANSSPTVSVFCHRPMPRWWLSHCPTKWPTRPRVPRILVHGPYSARRRLSP
jgi:hypothetical protein